MAKIDWYKLARGAKLLVSHIYSPLQLMQNQITSTASDDGISADQMDAKHAPFRINLSVPHLSSYTNHAGTPDGMAPMHAIPFMLPPLQEDMDFTANANTGNIPKVSSDTPEILLDEISISFDTRCEPGAIVSNWATGHATAGASAHQGKISYERVTNYNLKLAILERSPKWGQTAITDTSPSQMIWSGEVVASVELASGYIRTGNPYVVTDIRRAIDPYKSYIFVITAPQLGTTLYTDLVSLEISMRFLSPLRERDSGATIQNIPTRHLGERNKLNTYTGTGAGQHSSTARPLITATPTAGNDIEANTATGVQTSMAVIDEFFRAKLKGGYDMNSEVPVLESVKDSAAYTVLAVPLFNNTRFGGVSTPNPIGTPVGFPYVTSTAGKFIDRRYVPIVAPMTIHHVLFTWSWIPFIVPDGAGGITFVREIPEGTAAGEELRLDIGVGMGTGARADMFGYEQVARRSLRYFSPAAGTGIPNWIDSAVDLIAFQSVNTMPLVGGQTYTHNLELHSMDLEGSGQPGLNGMTAQGYPIFAGRGWSGVGTTNNPQRTNMQATAAQPETIGAEQWLEVRAQVYDNSGNWGSGWKADQMLVGTGGLWVYIIGKTHLV